jgi:hypothetical protein
LGKSGLAEAFAAKKQGNGKEELQIIGDQPIARAVLDVREI